MASLTSREALKRLDQTEFVAMATRTHQATVSTQLNEVFRPLDESADGQVFDWDRLQELHAGLLEHAAREIRQADQVHRLNRVKAQQLRQRRLAVVNRYKEHHRDLRQSFAGTYGAPALALVGLDAPPASRFLAIREQAREVLERMRDPGLAARLPAPRSGQVALDLALLANVLEAVVQELEEVLEELVELRKSFDESLVMKESGFKRQRRIYANLGRIQESYYRLGGLDGLADRLRTGVARRPASGDGDPPPNGTPGGPPETPAPPLPISPGVSTA